MKLGVLLRENATAERSLAFEPSVLFGENFLVKNFNQVGRVPFLKFRHKAAFQIQNYQKKIHRKSQLVSYAAN